MYNIFQYLNRSKFNLQKKSKITSYSFFTTLLFLRHDMQRLQLS